MDSYQSDKKVDKGEFETGLREYGVNLSKAEINVDYS